MSVVQFAFPGANQEITGERGEGVDSQGCFSMASTRQLSSRIILTEFERGVQIAKT
jgi:hypothetical protein